MSQITTQIDDSGAVDPEKQPTDPSRRTWVGVACAFGGVAGVATAVPFVSSFAPSERARAAGAPVEVDITSLQPGQMTTVEWRGKPVWVLRRTEAQVAALPKLNDALADPQSERPGFTPEYAQNVHRSRNPEFFVAVGICTHLGCSPTPQLAAGMAPGCPQIGRVGFSALATAPRSTWRAGYSLTYRRPTTSRSPLISSRPTAPASPSVSTKTIRPDAAGGAHRAPCVPNP